MAKVSNVGGPGLLSIPTIALAEVRYGLEVMADSKKKTRLLTSLSNLLATGIDTRPFSAQAAVVSAEVRAKLEAAGVPIDFPDSCIASVAIAENKTLASNDTVFEDVKRVCGLRFERWEV